MSRYIFTGVPGTGPQGPVGPPALQGPPAPSMAMVPRGVVRAEVRQALAETLGGLRGLRGLGEPPASGNAAPGGLGRFFFGLAVGALLGAWLYRRGR